MQSGPGLPCALAHVCFSCVPHDAYDGFHIVLLATSPPGLLHTALQQMTGVTRHPDFLLVTGDTVAHNLTAEETLLALRQVSSGCDLGSQGLMSVRDDAQCRDVLAQTFVLVSLLL